MNIFSKLKNKTFSSLAVRNFRLYFFGQIISLSGTWMQTVAQSWLVLKLTNSGTALGVVTALQFLPILFFAPVAGLMADRLSKRNLLYFSQSFAGLLALTLGILVATNLVRLWMVDILALGLGFANAIDNPTRQVFYHEMVGKDKIQNAVSLNATLQSITRVSGPALAGILIATVGLAPCFFINAASFAAVLVALFLMREKELFRVPLAIRAKGQLREGFRYVASEPVIRNTLLMLALVGIFTYEFFVTFPLIAKFTLHGGAGTYAVMTTILGLGSSIGGLFAATRRKNLPKMLIFSCLLFGLATLVFSVLPNLVLMLAAIFFVGVFSVSFISFTNTTLQMETKLELRGRVMSLWTVAFLGSTAVGGPIIGWIGEHAGPRWGLAVGGFVAVLAAVFSSGTLWNKQEAAIPADVEVAAEEEIAEDMRLR